MKNVDEIRFEREIEELRARIAKDAVRLVSLETQNRTLERQIEVYRESWKREIDAKRAAQTELEDILTRIASLAHSPGHVTKEDLEEILGL